MGIGMVIWLLEDERQQVLAASEPDRAPGLPRLADRPAQPQPVAATPEIAPLGRPRPPRAARRPLPRPRPLQGGQRVAGATAPATSCCKRVSERLRRRPPQHGPGRAGGRGRVRRPPARHRRRGRRGARRREAAEHDPPPLRPPGREIYLTASIGISRFPEDGADAESPAQARRDRHVPGQGAQPGRLPGLPPEHGLPTPWSSSRWRADLRRALAPGRKELRLYYQPVLDSGGRRVEGVEALLRWQHPSAACCRRATSCGSPRLPASATRSTSGCCAPPAARSRPGASEDSPNLRLAVNLSPRSFQQPDLLERVQEVLHETGLPPSALEIEITETLAMQNAEATLTVLRA